MGSRLGIFALIEAPQGPVSLALGAALIVYGLYSLTGPSLPEVRSAGWAVPVGLLSGALGGAFNTNGPPIVVYGSLKRWSPEVFRATLQANFLTAAFFIALGHVLGGLWTERVLVLFAATVPVLAAGFWIGRCGVSPDPRGSIRRCAHDADRCVGSDAYDRGRAGVVSLCLSRVL